MAYDSFFAEFLVAFQARINDQVPAVRWTDQDLGQLEHYDQRPAVSFPCLLIDFPKTQYDQEGNQVQFGNTELQARLGFPAFSSANSLAPDSAKQKALEYYNIELAIYKALQNWAPIVGGEEICQRLTRTAAITEKRNDAIRVRALVFTTAFEDRSASPVITKLQRPLKIDPATISDGAIS